jgi:hypothetical protein
MKAIKSKRWYDSQFKARENAIVNLTKLHIQSGQVSNTGAGDITLRNRVKRMQDEFNELRAERDMYYA